MKDIWIIFHFAESDMDESYVVNGAWFKSAAEARRYRDVWDSHASVERLDLVPAE